MAAHPRVVVLGGGFGGLEATFYLRHKLGSAVDLTLVSDRDYFLFKPNTIYIPYGEDPEQYKIPLDRPTKRQHIEFIQASVKEIDPEARRVVADGREVRYDYLIVATGAAMRPEEIPGFKEHALTLWTPEEMLALRAGLQRIEDKARAGERQRVVFVVPPNNRCSGPLYELVLMLDTWLRQRKVRETVDLTWTTMEEGYIQACGPRLNTVVAEEFETPFAPTFPTHTILESHMAAGKRKISHADTPSPSPAANELRRAAHHAQQTRRQNDQQAKIASLPVQNQHAAGIDVGDANHWVCVEATPDNSNTVRDFPAHTPGLRQLIDWLRQCGVTTVALEATGAYAHVLFLGIDEIHALTLVSELGSDFTKCERTPSPSKAVHRDGTGFAHSRCGPIFRFRIQPARTPPRRRDGSRLRALYPSAEHPYRCWLREAGRRGRGRA